MKQHFGKYLGPTLIDESEPLTAWRTWRLDVRTTAAYLTGTWAKTTLWEPNGGVTVAQCLNGKAGCNVSMAPGCNCGLWSAIAITNLLKHGAIALYPTGVLGRVHLWGFVHVYEYGVRAMMGRPTECWLGNSTGGKVAQLIEKTYRMSAHLNLPIEVVADPDLLEPAKVLTAARAYIAAQNAVATQARPAPGQSILDRTTGRPNLLIPDGRRRCETCKVRHRSGDKQQTCPKRAALVDV